MEIKNYINIVIKRLWIILLLPAVAGIITGYISFYVLTPVYQANTTLYIINRPTSSAQADIAMNDLLVGQQLVKDYRELLKSRSVTQDVIDGLKISGLSPVVLAKKITVNAKNDTRIIEIGVQDENPDRATIIANEISKVFIQKVTDLMKVENVNIVDSAVKPDAPVKPRPLMNLAIAVFAGLMAGIGLAFLIEYLDDTIKNDEDVEKYLGLTVLGTIPMLNMK